MNGIKILPVPCRITLPLTYTLTEKGRNKTHAMRIKKMCASKNRTCAHKLDTSASVVYTKWSFCFSIVGGLPF